MKTILNIFAVLIINFTFSQNKQFIYVYKFIPDSTNIENVAKEFMILNVDKEKSEYYSAEQYNSDSTQVANTYKGLMNMPTNKEMINLRIEKFPNIDKIKFIERVGNTKYLVNEDVHLTWKLLPEFSTILYYKVQKASTNFGGRHWTAWFAKDIAIQDGPYKFKGLPGLILKIEDDSKSHNFELKAIKNSIENLIYPEVNNYKKIEVSYSQYLKAYKNYRKYPAADLIGKIPDQTDSEGNFRKGSDIIKEIEKNQLARIKKDNNIIEIDILKEN